MRFALALAMLVLAAPVAWAAEPAVEVVAAVEAVEAGVTVDAPAAPEMALDPVSVPEVRSERVAVDGATQDMPQRGSFWWLVGAIVIAGVILALVLD